MVRRKIGAQLNRPFLGFRFVGGDRNAGVLCAGGEKPVVRAGVCGRVRVGSSIYGFLQGAWPFGLVEAAWLLVALHRWRRVAKS